MSRGEQELAREGNSERVGRENKKSMNWMSLAGQQAVVFTSRPNNKFLYRVPENGTKRKSSVRIFWGKYLLFFFYGTSGVLRGREGMEEVCTRQALRGSMNNRGPGPHWTKAKKPAAIKSISLEVFAESTRAVIKSDRCLTHQVITQTYLYYQIRQLVVVCKEKMDGYECCCRAPQKEASQVWEAGVGQVWAGGVMYSL